MSATISNAQSGQATNVGTGTVTKPFNHAAGTGAFAIVAQRTPTPGALITGVTYDGAAMTQIVASALAGGSSPYVQISAWRLADPGVKTAVDLVATFDGSTVNNCIIFFYDVAGYGWPVDSSGSAVSNSTTSLDVTHARVSAATLTVYAAAVARPTTVVSWSPDDGMTEEMDVDMGISSTISMTLCSLVETASGSLVRSSTNNDADKVAALAFSLTAAVSGQPARKRLGGVPFATSSPGVW